MEIKHFDPGYLRRTDELINRMGRSCVTAKREMYSLWSQHRTDFESLSPNEIENILGRAMFERGHIGFCQYSKIEE